MVERVIPLYAPGGIRGSIIGWQWRKPEPERRQPSENMAGSFPMSHHSSTWDAFSWPLMMTGRRLWKTFESTGIYGCRCLGSWSNRGIKHRCQEYVYGGGLVRLSIWVIDVGGDPPYWQDNGRFPPQIVPPADGYQPCRRTNGRWDYHPLEGVMRG